MYRSITPSHLKVATMLSKLPSRVSLWIGTASLLASCTSSPPPSAPPVATEPQTLPASSPATTGIASRVSYASTARDYRRDGAAHLYARNTNRIFSGKMPPLLYASGVLQVDINASGGVTAVRWMRAPKHAPEVIAEIERAVRAAAPFPAPIKLGKVTYTDTWLWHKSGQFQLDTLTEGQL